MLAGIVWACSSEVLGTVREVVSVMAMLTMQCCVS